MEVGAGGSVAGKGDEASGAPQGVVKSVSLGDSTSVRPERDCERPGWQSLASCGPVKVRWMEDARMGEVAVALLSRLRDSGPGYARAYARMLQGLLLATAPGFVCTALVADTLVPALFGPAWSDAAPVVAWLAVAGAVLILETRAPLVVIRAEYQ